jgi:hypothetical protein
VANFITDNTDEKLLLLLHIPYIFVNFVGIVHSLYNFVNVYLACMDFDGVFAVCGYFVISVYVTLDIFVVLTFDICDCNLCFENL